MKMNKDLVNLILSYFTISTGDIDNYITNNRPTTFAIYTYDNYGNSNYYGTSSYTYYLITFYKYSDTYYSNVDDSSIDTETGNGITTIVFENGKDRIEVGVNPKTLTSIRTNWHNIIAVDLITTFRILSTKYNKYLAKTITLAKIKLLFDNIFLSSTANLLRYYLNLSTEFRILNLSHLPIYFFDDIEVDHSDNIVAVASDETIAEVKQKLHNLAIDVDKMYKQVYIAVSKF